MNNKIIPLLWLAAFVLSGLAWADAEMKPGPSAYGKSAARYDDWRFDGPEGRGFAYYLAQNYRRYAKHEDNAHDFSNAAKFLARAEAVERGERVDPEPLAHRTLPIYAVRDLTMARERLVLALRNGASATHPKQAAQAQVMFDCWMEQQEENIQPHDVHACRQGFEEAMAMFEPPPAAKLEPPPPPPVEPEPAPLLPAQCPEQSCPKSPLSFIIYFDFDRHDLTATAKDTLQQVVMAIRERNPAQVTITAHADRAGASSYNEALSKRRLDVVIDNLRQAGINEQKIIVGSYFGERRRRVETADGKRNPENRRVEIKFQ